MTSLLPPIAFAADHAGLYLKNALVAHAKTLGYRAEDLGTHSDASVDYPDFAHRLAEWMEDKAESYGVLVCGSGIGISIAANRHGHLRAALCRSGLEAALARQHNEANVLCLGERITGDAVAKDCLERFLTTEFEGGRHAARVEKITPK